MVALYADGADLTEMLQLNKNPKVAGFTTNPTLMRKAGVTDFALFGVTACKQIGKPISFEVFADDFINMERQAKVISRWGKNVYVKIPITNTKGESSIPLIASLTKQHIKVNVTAVFTTTQVRALAKVMGVVPSIMSIFAGRIADTGVDPSNTIRLARSLTMRNVQILWASTRELINIKQAQKAGADIITVPNDMLKKMDIFGKDLKDYSLETVKQFYNDAVESGYVL